MNHIPPFLLLFVKPRAAVRKFLKNPEYKNIAIFLFLLSAFLSLFGQYPQNTLLALSSVAIIFGGDFLYCFLLFSLEKSSKKADFWSVYGAVSISLLPLIIGRIIFVVFLISFFGITALYSGVNSVFKMRETSLAAFLIVMEIIVFSLWFFYAQIQCLSEIQDISATKAFWRIILYGFSIMVLTAFFLFLFARIFGF